MGARKGRCLENHNYILPYNLKNVSATVMIRNTMRWFAASQSFCQQIISNTRRFSTISFSGSREPLRDGNDFSWMSDYCRL